MPRLLLIHGSYRSQGIIDQAMLLIEQHATTAGWKTQSIPLIDQDIRCCRNCRCCLQTPGPERGTCTIEDDVARILDAADRSDALVLASPTNFFDVTAITRAFLERLVVTGHWPWGQRAPTWRKPVSRKPSLLITSTAMPALMARFLTHSMGTLKSMSRCLCAQPVGKLYVGTVARAADEQLTRATQQRLIRATERLLAHAR